MVCNVTRRQFVRFMNLMGFMFEQSHPLKGMTVNDARCAQTPYGLLRGIVEDYREHNA